MSRSIIFSASLVAFAAFAASAQSQTALSSCNPVTGLTPGGAPCVLLTPIDPSDISSPDGGADGSERYERLDTTTLGQTYECRSIDGQDRQYGDGGALLIEDCGAPLTGAELGQLNTFYGTTGLPAPLPPAPAPVPVAVAPVVPPVAPPVVVAAPAAGLGGAGLALGALGAAALVGIIAVAINDDDDSTSSTTTTQPR